MKQGKLLSQVWVNYIFEVLVDRMLANLKFRQKLANHRLLIENLSLDRSQKRNIDLFGKQVATDNMVMLCLIFSRVKQEVGSILRMEL